MDDSIVNKESLLKFLSQLSIGDTLHDFGDVKINENTIYTTLLKDDPPSDNYLKNIYCSGLPIELDKCYDRESLLDSNSEQTLLNKIFQKQSRFPQLKRGETFSIVPKIDPDIKGLKKTNLNEYYSKISEIVNTGYFNYAITTKNNIKYNCKAVAPITGKDDFNNKIYITSNKLLDALNIKENSAILIDALQISLLDILTNTKKQDGENEKKIYYIFTSETQNDPAKKTNVFIDKPHNSPFNKTGKQVKLIPINEKTNIDISHIYKFNSSDDNISNIYSGKYEKVNGYDSFFSKYTFKLSGLKEKKVGLTSKIYTDLSIDYMMGGRFLSKIIDDSKNSNDITYLKSNLATSIHSTIKELKKSKKPNSDIEDLIFDINSNFQQKRSGDWLQVLSCKNLKEKILCINNYSDDSNEIKRTCKKGNGINEDTDIYFVTNDQIALCFALLNGVNSIYTNGYTESCYSFSVDKEPTPPLETEAINNMVNTLNYLKEIYEFVKVEQKNINEGGSNENKNFIYFTAYNTTYDFYNKECQESLTKLNDFLFNINTTTGKLEFKIPIELTQLIINIRELFQSLYKYSLFLKTFDDISLPYIKRNKNIENILKTFNVYNIDNEISRLKNDNPTRSQFFDNTGKLINKKLKNVINNYYELKKQNSKLEMITSYLNYDVIDATTELPKMDISDIISHLSDYKMIDMIDWNTDKIIDYTRTLDYYVILGDYEKSYKSDYNSFLYTLNNIPDLISEEVLNIFNIFYETFNIKEKYYLKNPGLKNIFVKNELVSLSEYEHQKFYSFIVNFSLEVNIALGGNFVNKVKSSSPTFPSQSLPPTSAESEEASSVSESEFESESDTAELTLTEDESELEEGYSINELSINIDDYISKNKVNAINKPIDKKITDIVLVNTIVDSINSKYENKEVSSTLLRYSRKNKVFLNLDEQISEPTEDGVEESKNDTEEGSGIDSESQVTTSELGKTQAYLESESKSEEKIEELKIIQKSIFYSRIDKIKSKIKDFFKEKTKTSDEIKKEVFEEILQEGVKIKDNIPKDKPLFYKRMIYNLRGGAGSEISNPRTLYKSNNSMHISNILLTNILLTNYNEYILHIIEERLSNAVSFGGGNSENNRFLKMSGGLSSRTEDREGEEHGEGEILMSNYANKIKNEIISETLNKNNIFKLNECFHPLLPCFMMAQELYNMSFTDIYESFDFDLFKGFITLIHKLYNSINDSYLTNDIKTQSQAYIIGIGIKELLFTKDISYDYYKENLKCSNDSDNLIRQIDMFKNQLSYSIIGKNINVVSDLNILTNPIFTDFIDYYNINYQEIFMQVHNHDTIEEYVDINILKKKIQYELFVLINQINDVITYDKQSLLYNDILTEIDIAILEEEEARVAAERAEGARLEEEARVAAEEERVKPAIPRVKRARPRLLATVQQISATNTPIQPGLNKRPLTLFESYESDEMTDNNYITQSRNKRRKFKAGAKNNKSRKIKSKFNNKNKINNLNKSNKSKKDIKTKLNKTTKMLKNLKI